MNFSNETLMAYVDAELDADTRAAVEAAIATDPEVAARVGQQRTLRTSLQSAFDAVLAEPVPASLVHAARSAPTGLSSGKVADLASVRSARAKARTRSSASRVSWGHWGAIAASLFVGVIAGQYYFSGADTGPFATRGTQLVARGVLADSLATQLASTQARSSAVRIDISFRTRGGEYCRTFALQGGEPAGSELAGIACRTSSSWNIEVLAATADHKPGGYRMAAGEMPKPVYQALEDTIAGEPLDAAAEAAARVRGWRP